MRRCWGACAAMAGAVIFGFAGPAGASQGTDTVVAPGYPVNGFVPTADYASYQADPGEANRLELMDFHGYTHLVDTGAIIRWVSLPPPYAGCAGGVHDVFCTRSDLVLSADLGDGNDTYVSHLAVPAEIDLGPGNDRAVGGTGSDRIVGGPGADDIRGGGVSLPYTTDSADYHDAAGPVTVTDDDLANDGRVGERDNVHSDILEVDGSSFADTITGFPSAAGGDGSDTITLGAASGRGQASGNGGDDTLVGGPSPDDVYGHDGNDRIDVRGGDADHVWCGTGVDTVIADSSDVMEPDCEDVQIG